MARIRSVHPGFFTDENLVSVSMAARLFFIGLGVEADDKGVFEWKPLTLKMRIFPGDNVDVGPLLDELVAADAIKAYEINGRQYGAIRNFRKFQKPKTPNDTHPAPAEIRNYVGLTDGISETRPVKQPPFPPKGEKSPQMEDGGGKREKEREEIKAASQQKARAEIDGVLAKCIEAAGITNAEQPNFQYIGPIVDLLDEGMDLEGDVLPVLRAIASRGNKGRSWKYYASAVIAERQGSDERRKAAREVVPAKAEGAIIAKFYDPDWFANLFFRLNAGSPVGTMTNQAFSDYGSGKNGWSVRDAERSTLLPDPIARGSPAFEAWEAWFADRRIRFPSSLPAIFVPSEYPQERAA